MTSRYLINNKCNFTRIMNKKIEIKYAFDIKYNIKYKLDITNLYSLLMIQSYLYHDELSERFNQLVTDRQKLYTDRKQRRNTLSSSLYVIFAVYLKFLARCTAAVRHVVPCVSFIKASRSVSRALLDPNSNPGLEVERFDLTLTRSHWTMLLLCPIVVAARLNTLNCESLSSFRSFIYFLFLLLFFHESINKANFFTDAIVCC